MQLESIKAELRARSDHEAADLGVLMLRALAWPSLRAWLGFVLPLQVAVLLLFAAFSPGVGFLLIWWLKPLYDRAYGLVLGRGLFGAAPSLRALYKALWRDGRRALLRDLLWGRFDPARTLRAPVALLEGLRGKQAARRRQTLTQGRSKAVWLLLTSHLIMEQALCAGLSIGAGMLVPDEAQYLAEELWSVSWNEITFRLWLACYVLTIGLVEPLFVAGGFGLYIDQRTRLEGWDVELTFRRMARRMARVGALLLLLQFGQAQAQEPAMTSSAAEDDQRLPAVEVGADEQARATQAMQRVLARPELQRSQVEEHWELRDRQVEERESAAPSLWWMHLASGLANVFELLIWLGASAAIAALLLALVRRLPRPAQSAPTVVLPAFVTAMQGQQAAAPLPLSEVVPTVLALLTRGEQTAALSVLYVGALTGLMQLDGLRFSQHDTEGRCLQIVRAAPIASQRHALFERLTQLWQLSAYAHRQPESARLTELCSDFRACFEGA